MGRIAVPKSLLELFRDSEARIDGTHLQIRFPTGQLIGFGLLVGGIGMTVVFAIWLTTRDLSGNMKDQTAAIGNLDTTVSRLTTTVHEIDKRAAINSHAIEQHRELHQ